jgi:hypothetical protein
MREVNLNGSLLCGKANEVIFAAIYHHHHCCLLLDIYKVSLFENLPGEGLIGLEFSGDLIGKARLRVVLIENGGK